MNKVINHLFIKSFIHKIKPFIPLLIIIILPFLFFGQAVVGKTLIVAGDFSGSDLLDMHLPFKYAFTQAVIQKELPLWTPYLSNGFPLLAEGQTGILYPPNFIFALLPPALALNYSIILAFILAGVFTFIYCRSLGYSRFSSLASAITFMFSAFFVTRLKHVNLIAVAAWTPFIFLTTRKFFQEEKLIYALLTGVALGLQFLAGHPQMAFYSLFIFLLYFVFEFFLSLRRSSFAKIFPLTLVSLTIITLVTFGLSAIQTLPTLELTQQGERVEYSFQVATAYPFHPRNLIEFISPYFFGNPATGSYQQDIRSMGVFWENSSYVGLLPVVLLPWVIYMIVKKKRQPHLIFFLILGLFSLLLMLGKFTPLFGLLWSTIPGFTLFRFPTRFNLYLMFSLAILTGLGVELLLTKLQKNYQETTPSPSEAKAEFRLSWPLDPLKTKVLILGFIIIDLFVFGKNYVGSIETKTFFQKPKSVEFLEKDKDLFRIWSVTQYMESPYQTLGWKTNLSPLLAIHEAIPPNNNLIYGLQSFSDRGWFEGGLNFKRRNMVERFLIDQAQDPYKLGQVLGLANIKYLLTFAEIKNSELPLLQEINLGKEFGVTLKIYENKQVLPRFFYVPEAKVISEEKALFEELTAGSFYPVKTVLLEKPPLKILPSFGGVVDEFRKENRVEIKKYTASEVILDTDLKNDGFLVLSDSYYPGWKVAIDGKKGEILPANFLFRAVQLQPGKHLIHFYYDPLSFKIGLIISGTTFVLIIVSLGGYFASKKTRPGVGKSQ